MNAETFRLRPGEDLYQAIEAFTARQQIQAGCVLCGVGSLTHATLRLANQSDYAQYEGHFEIVSITGTVSIHGSHLHVAISDEQGRTVGGHLVPGCIIYTTAEIVIGSFPGVVYRREFAADLGYEELVVIQQ